MSQLVFEPLPEKLLDFKYALYLIWKHLDLPEPTRLQYDIADYLQAPSPRRKIIEAFRGVGKSWITSAFVVHSLRINPQLRFLVTSASKERSDNFSTFTLRLIHTNPLYQCLIPQEGQRESKVSFDVGPAGPDHAPSVKSVGIFGQMSGSRADYIIADDVEIPSNSMTQLMRERLSNAVKEFDAILKPDDHSQIIYLGTPQCEQSIYVDLQNRGYEARVWPARYPDPKNYQDVYRESLAPLLEQRLLDKPELKNAPTDPKRFSDVDLTERELSYGKSGFALQFQLDTRLSDDLRYPLKLSDLIVMDLDARAAPEKVYWAQENAYILNDLPVVGLAGDRLYRAADYREEYIDYQGAVLAIDPSGRGSDETGYAVVKMLNGNLFVLEAGGLIGGHSQETMEFLAKLARDQKVNLVLIESNFGDGMYQELLKPYLNKIYPVGIEEVRSTVRKELRLIDTLEPVFNQHRIVVNKKLFKEDLESIEKYPGENRLAYSLFFQITRLTKEKGALLHDDRIDALEMGVRYWQDKIALEQEEAAKQRQADLLDLELRNFIDGTGVSIDQLVLGMSIDQIRMSNGESKDALWAKTW